MWHELDEHLDDRPWNDLTLEAYTDDESIRHVIKQLKYMTLLWKIMISELSIK